MAGCIDTVCIIRMHRDYGRRHTEMAGYMQIMAEYGKMSAGNSRTLYRVLAGNSQIEAGYRKI
jgi:hypothetical protein